jgi:pimeloyl-ACP methyl ester carboxylesterase
MRFVILATATLFAFHVGPAAPHASRRIQSARASETFDAGMLRVEHFGHAGKTPIIFIPALTFGASQWQRQIATLSDSFDIYALTLPGFDGRPHATGGDLMNRASADISALIASRHLDHPIIVGHSLGGTLAVYFGVHHSAEVRGIISAEGGYPFAATAQERAQRLAQISAPYRGIAPSTLFDSLQKYQLQYTITGKAAVDSVKPIVSRSDPVGIVDWLEAAAPLDLGAELQHISVPLTEIVPFDADIDPHQGFATLAAKTAAYETFLAHALRGSLIMIDHSRHFVMIDQPAAFDRALYTTISALARRS